MIYPAEAVSGEKCLGRIFAVGPAIVRERPVDKPETNLALTL